MKNWQFKNALQSSFGFRKGKNIPWRTGKFWLISVLGIFSITAIYFLFTYEGSIKKTTKTPIPQELKVLRSSFDKVKQISDPLLREYTIQKEAQRLKIQVINYRQLFDIYRKNKEFLPDYPDNRLSIPGWFQWFFIEVSPPKRLELFKNIFIFVIEKGVVLTALLALGKYLWETPQRKKQELYQAIQVLYLVTGKPSQLQFRGWK